MNIRITALALLLVSGAAWATTVPARAADVFILHSRAVPVYDRWQPAWDRFEYDRRHVILGTVTDFQPFRLQIARPNGRVQMIDLKNGTIILPTGITPIPNERVAIVGYYSNGTFIANRVVVRS